MTRAALYIVATPIGNLDDMTPRAIRTLKEVDLIAAEDSRRAGMLLAHFQIPKKPFISYHDHVEQDKAAPLVARIQREDLAVALIADAGTPCIADPGYRLVAEARRVGVPVHPIPGVSALTALISASGLPSHRFTFVGFLPVKEKALRDEVRSWQHGSGSIVFYEAPRRLTKTLRIMAEELPHARVAIGRELTKLHEEIVLLTIDEALAWAENHQAMRGEAAVMVDLGQRDSKPLLAPEAIAAEARRGFAAGKTIKDLLREFKDCGLSRSELYQLLLSAKKEDDA